MNFSERNIAEWNTEWALLNIEEEENLRDIVIGQGARISCSQGMEQTLGI